jgi:iron complex transport system substrate-binding protein
MVVAAAGAAAPRRVVCLSPNLTEILYGIGAFDLVVGVSDYCTYPAAVTKLPTVGGWATPDLERLIGLHPDLVILDDALAPLIEDKFKDLGLHTLVARDHTIDQSYEAMLVLGRATGHEDGAARLVSSTRDGLQRVARKTAGLSKPGVILIVDRTPGTLRDLYMATAGGFLAEIVQIAGGRVASPAAKEGYAKLSKEDLLAINPDIILDCIHWVKSGLAGDPMEAWREMPELKAVRGHRVHGVGEDYVPHASQRMVQTAELFARLIHPEAK